MEGQSDTLLDSQNATPLQWRPASIWRRLTGPPDEILLPDLRRRMQILASLLLILIPASMFVLLLWHMITLPSVGLLSDPVVVLGIIVNAFLVVSYRLSRSGRTYSLGAVIALLTIAAGALYMTVEAPGDAETLLIFMSLLILIASMLLPVRGTVILALVVNLAIIPLPSVVPTLKVAIVVNVLVFNLLMSALIVAAAVIRQRDLQQIEDQSRRLTEAIMLAEETNRLKGQFLATMSHELRTPLNAIIGFTEVMMMGLAGTLDTQAMRTTERIHHNSERLLALIDDLLDISKIEAGRLEVVSEAFAPADLLKEVERATRQQAVDKGLELVATVDPALPAQIAGDTQRLEQIALNLVTNAIKFTDKGMVSVSMTPSGDGHWAIVVTDTGIGIPSHAQEFIFEKFRQVDGTSRRAYGGAGLGLAIVKELTVLMEGQIRLQSAVGQGSTFTVTLPLVIPGKGIARNG